MATGPRDAAAWAARNSDTWSTVARSHGELTDIHNEHQVIAVLSEVPSLEAWPVDIIEHRLTYVFYVLQVVVVFPEAGEVILLLVVSATVSNQRNSIKQVIKAFLEARKEASLNLRECSHEFGALPNNLAKREEGGEHRKWNGAHIDLMRFLLDWLKKGTERHNLQWGGARIDLMRFRTASPLDTLLVRFLCGWLRRMREESTGDGGLLT